VHTSTGAAVRSAGITIGGLGVVVFVAIGVGAVAARLAPHDAMFTVALSATAASALLSGLAAGPVLRPLRHRLEPGAQADLAGSPSPTAHAGDGTVPAGR
jgi:hypothetical protein